ncbi:MAG: tetratricopeptide repeat protein [Alphaproteobacteria bacterium]|nr:tetratricopeptide repeat protein [Alphaproteobacteria bacterium]
MTGAAPSPASAAEIWRQAAQLINDGKAAEADAALRSALSRLGDAAELLHLRAVALMRLGRAGEALPILEKVTLSLPGRTDVLMNLGHALLELSRPLDAVDPLTRVAGASPPPWEAVYLLGLAHERSGAPAPAAAAYERALALNPDLWEARLRLMSLYRVLERYGDAIAAARAAIAARPHEDAVQHDLAMLLALAGEPANALTEVDVALRRQPHFPEALNTRGNILGDLERGAEAAASYRRALALVPNLPDPHYNLANIDRAAEGYEAAFRGYRRALAAQPGLVMARNNLATAQLAAGEVGAAIATYTACLAVAPGWPEAIFNRSMAFLLKGDMRSGLEGYEARWQVRGFPSPIRNFPQPLWDGAPFAGRRLLLHPEQGDGDTIQFARYVPLIAARGGEVLLECPRRLLALFASLPGNATLVRPGDTLPPFDLQLPLGSVMRVFATEISSIPGNVPYLQAAPDRRERWQSRLGLRGYRIGLTWQGNPSQGAEPHRSIRLTLLEPLLAVPGTRFFALQKEFGRDQIDRLPPGLLDDVGPALDDYADTAAAISALDLVITTCTSVAHLAGALGKPVWVLLRRTPDWRWLLDRDDSPWYPTARLFRQRRPGDWPDVVARVAQALVDAVGARHP